MKKNWLDISDIHINQKVIPKDFILKEKEE
jgi:hypothetical protein